MESCGRVGRPRKQYEPEIQARMDWLERSGLKRKRIRTLELYRPMKNLGFVVMAKLALGSEVRMGEWL